MRNKIIIALLLITNISSISYIATYKPEKTIDKFKTINTTQGLYSVKVGLSLKYEPIENDIELTLFDDGKDIVIVFKNQVLDGELYTAKEHAEAFIMNYQED